MFAVRAWSTFFFSSITTNIKVNNIDTDPIIVAISAINVIPNSSLQLQSDEVETNYSRLEKLLQN
jgi:hypothetical protein